MEDTLKALGLSPFVVGVGSPSSFQHKPVVGGMKVYGEKVLQLQPTHLLSLSSQKTWELERICQNLSIHCYFFSQSRWEDVEEQLLRIAHIFSKEKEGKEWLRKLRESLKACSAEGATYLYVLWWKPLIIAGRQTFIHSLFSALGFSHALPQVSGFPQISWEELLEKVPTFLFVSQDAGPPPKVLQPYLPPPIYLSSDGINRPGLTLIQATEEICASLP